MGLSFFEWLAFAVLAAAAFGFAAWHYARREEPRRHNGVLAALRGAALALALFLLFDPSWPAAGRAREAETVWLLDGSRSMSRPSESATLWAAARELAGHAGGPVWVFGGATPQRWERDSLPTAPPFGSSQLAPAIRAAAQAGHRTVRVISDGELADASEALAWAERYGLRWEWTPLTTTYPRVSISDVQAPAWAEVGDTVSLRAAVSARGVTASALTLIVTDARDRVVARAQAAVPGDGRFAEVRLLFRLEEPAGLQRFSVALADPLGDEERRDDRRAVYIDVSGPPASPVVLALEPSWEATFLLPSLGQARAAPAAGYVRLRPDRWVTMGEGFRVVSPQEIRRRSAAAPLLVLVAYDSDAPPWVNVWAREAPRVWIFPAGEPFVVPGWDIRIGRLEEGEWYADPALPPSPITGVLAGIDVELFPPLAGLRSVDGPGAWAPLMVRRGRRGEPRPALVAGTSGGRRWAVTPGIAYWRWGFRPGAPRDLYRGLTTGTAGWLLEERTRGARVDLVERVVSEGTPFRFALSGALDSLHLVVVDSAGAPAWSHDGPSGTDTLATPALPVGRYRFQADVWAGGRRVTSSSGPAEVEAFHRELVPVPIASLDSLPGPAAGRTDGAEAAAEAAAGRVRLRREGWPALLILALLCAEWILRQRLGLR